MTSEILIIRLQRTMVRGYKEHVVFEGYRS